MKRDEEMDFWFALSFACVVVLVAVAFGCLACSDHDSVTVIPAVRSLVCHDITGVGPDITLEPPQIPHQLEAIDGCFRNGRCYYNCGKKD